MVDGGRPDTVFITQEQEVSEVVRGVQSRGYVIGYELPLVASSGDAMTVTIGQVSTVGHAGAKVGATTASVRTATPAAVEAPTVQPATAAHGHTATSPAVTVEDVLTTESGDPLTTESGDTITVTT